MDKHGYAITGAVAGLIYSIFSNQNIIVAFLIILIGALWGISKWNVKEKHLIEFNELINGNETNFE